MTRSPYRLAGPAGLAAAVAAAKRPAVAASGNLGADLVALGTLPTLVSGYNQFATGTLVNTNYPSLPSISDGDTIVGAVSSVALGADSITFTIPDGTPTWLDTQRNAQAGTNARYWFARAFEHVYDVANGSDPIGGNITNRLMMLTQVAFNGVGATPELLEMSLPNAAGRTSIVSNVVTFPLCNIPAGWSFVFGVHKFDDSGADTWVNATQIASSSTTALNDGRVVTAIADGPETDLAVTWTDSSGQMAADGGMAYVIAVPGTA